ncbi:DedA family protein [Clostridium sp. SHJSY1]|uniref:DedA family protein n=1 Tax=Clostridium sp. SHJSY1 TaxID=2942483 RepID=UPI0028758123|nr:DedA family protein [Clostridium sp. SHJSY1]MDS0526261.1 DedA family protein [Clostridium sp. SHJSY1]
MKDLILSFMETHGYLGTFLMILLENVFPPIPSEVILTFGGFMTTYTNLTVIGIIVSATLGSVVGAAILYKIGHALSIKKLESIINKYGHILRLKISDIEKANSWFDKYGYITIFLCRMVPLIRSLISIPAGMTNMKFSLFMIYTTLGTLIWNSILVYIGSVLGSSWEDVLVFMDAYSNIIYGILGCLLLAYLFVLLKRKSKNKI